MFARKSNKPTKKELDDLLNTLLSHTQLYIDACEKNLQTCLVQDKKQTLKIQLSYFEAIKSMLNYKKL